MTDQGQATIARLEESERELHKIKAILKAAYHEELRRIQLGIPAPGMGMAQHLAALNMVRDLARAAGIEVDE